MSAACLLLLRQYSHLCTSKARTFALVKQALFCYVSCLLSPESRARPATPTSSATLALAPDTPVPHTGFCSGLSRPFLRTPSAAASCRGPRRQRSSGHTGPKGSPRQQQRGGARRGYRAASPCMSKASVPHAQESKARVTHALRMQQRGGALCMRCVKRRPTA